MQNLLYLFHSLLLLLLLIDLCILRLEPSLAAVVLSVIARAVARDGGCKWRMVHIYIRRRGHDYSLWHLIPWGHVSIRDACIKYNGSFTQDNSAYRRTTPFIDKSCRFNCSSVFRTHRITYQPKWFDRPKDQAG